MKIEELDEDWKKTVAGGAIGAALALTHTTLYDKTKKVDDVIRKTVKQAGKTVLSDFEILKTAAKQQGIKGLELAQFLAQCAHETGNFAHFVEQGSPNYFKKYDPVYAPKKAKALGNTEPGDGNKYKGRGYIQLTGRYNYKKAGEHLGIDLENHPELLENPKIAAKIAVWFWIEKVKPKIKDIKDVSQVTKPINPGLNGLEKRKEYYRKYSADPDLS